MKQILIKKGYAYSAEVPLPQLNEKEILVKVHTSCLSIGTELSGLNSSAVPLWKKTLKKPEKAIEIIKMVRDVGINRMLGMIEEKEKEEHVTGYSVAGVIVSVGSEIKDFFVGDRVACAGAQYAHHAEYIRVTRNLCVTIPKKVSYEHASTVTLGSIALQGVRRANPTIGEIFVVVGLGILGQITVQILKANGCKVIGNDTDKERIKTALSMGMDYALYQEDIENDKISRLTDGYGADGVIITAATKSNIVVSNAFKMCRKKGRVVLVGDVGLNINRVDLYEKEIDFYISTSYGPGRYDKKYEEEGNDYPIGYVRWTENRNMSEYLRLIDEERVKIQSLVSVMYDIKEASEAYKAINGEKKPLIAIMTYKDNTKNNELSKKRVDIYTPTKKKEDIINIALIGGGSFARSYHLPNIKKLNKQFYLKAIVNRTGPSAKTLSEIYPVDYISTNIQDIYNDDGVDAVLISTRHNMHSSLVISSLYAGKHVFVEKPLSIKKDELEIIKKYYEDSEIENRTQNNSKPILHTGYNRRFSPFAKRMKMLVENRTAPFIINYRMNAGYIPMEHWVHGEEGGGRNIGEACHIYDLFTYLTGSEVESISAHSIKTKNKYYSRNDNFVTTIRFNEGSVANLVYTALGNNKIQKETAELYVDGKIGILNDYKNFKVYGAEQLNIKTSIQDKGFFNEIESFALSIKTGEWSIPLWQQIQVSEISFVVEQMLYQ